MSDRAVRLAALLAVVAPLVGLLVLMYGGATIGFCHATVGDGSPRPACPIQVSVWPPMRTDFGIAVGLGVAALAWLLATGVVVARAASYDRRRRLRLAVAILAIATSAGAIGALNGLAIRLRQAAENGITWSLAGLVLGWLLAVVWIGLRPRDPQMSSERTR
jgi:hypothetical protein